MILEEVPVKDKAIQEQSVSFQTAKYNQIFRLNHSLWITLILDQNLIKVIFKLMKICFLKLQKVLVSSKMCKFYNCFENQIE